MIDETTEALIQQELDGENTSEQSAALAERLAADPAARDAFEEMQRLAASLASLKLVPPPVGLARRVLRQWQDERATNDSRRRLYVKQGRRVRPQTEAWVMATPAARGILIAGALVVVAGAVVYFGSGYPWKDGETAGAIGAVEKHRATQITADDVQLGGVEATVADIPFADFLQDSTVLGAAGADLAAAAELLGAASTLDAKSLEAVQAHLGAASRTLEAQMSDLKARSLAAMQTQLGAINSALEARAADLDRNAVTKMKAELGAVSSSLEAMSSLGARELAASPEFLQAASSLEAMSRSLGASSLGARSLGAMQSSLAAMSQELGAASLSAEQADAYAAGLQAMSASLQARESLQARTLDARQQLVGAMTLQAKELGAMTRQLEAMSLGASSLSAADARQLQAMSDQLGARSLGAQEFAIGGMRSALEARSLEARTLDAMTASLEAAVGNLGARNDLNAKTLGAMNAELGAFGEVLGARRQLAARSLSLGMQSQLQAMNDYLGAATLEARSLGVCQNYLGAVQNQLEASSAWLGAASLGAMQDQLGAASNALEAKSLEARSR